MFLTTHWYIAVLPPLGRVAGVTPGSPGLSVRVPAVVFLTSQGHGESVRVGTRFIPPLTGSIANSEAPC